MTGADCGYHSAIGRTEALARTRFGESCRVVDYRLLTRRAASVARVRLTGAPVETVIVKHLDAPATAAEMAADYPEFANEALNYRFLDALGLSGTLAPALIGEDPAGILMLGDLGDAYALPQRGYEHLVPALARALALLHGTTCGNVADYDALRMRAGLGSRSEDRRKYGAPGVRRLFQAGAALCLATEGRSHRQVAALAREFETVEAMMVAPGDYLVLIHDDLANARQTFHAGEAMYLLDFEQAKYSHALLDFVKPMIGKFEVDEVRGISGWQCPAFPIDLPARYRILMAEEHGRSPPEWDENLAAALIYGAVGLVGRMAAWDSRRRLRGTRRQNINGVIHRLSTLLTVFAAFPAVRAFTADYTAQFAV